MIELFNRDWEIDSAKKEIRRKDRSLLRMIVEFALLPQYEVKTLYRGANAWLSEEGITEDDIFDRTDIDVDGYPEIFYMKGDWRIKDNHRRYVYKGPLVYEGSSKPIIKEQRSLYNTILDNFGRPIGLLSGIAGLITFCAWVIGEFISN